MLRELASQQTELTSRPNRVTIKILQFGQFSAFSFIETCNTLYKPFSSHLKGQTVQFNRAYLAALQEDNTTEGSLLVEIVPVYLRFRTARLSVRAAVGTMTPEQLFAMEEELQVTLPPAYKKLIVTFPWPEFAGGTGLSLFDDAALNVERTREYRAGYGGAPPWPPDFVHIGDDADACPYAIRCSDGTIVKTDHGNFTKRPLATYASVDLLAREIQAGLDFASHNTQEAFMNARRVLAIFGIIALVVSLPFVIIHLRAASDDAPITPLQHVVAALANYFGPWGVPIVRLVDFPNAGLRSFSWALAAGLTLVGAALLILGLKVRHRPWQIFLSVLWGLFVAVWFGVGLSQIADGLL